MTTHAWDQRPGEWGTYCGMWGETDSFRYGTQDPACGACLHLMRTAIKAAQKIALTEPEAAMSMTNDEARLIAKTQALRAALDAAEERATKATDALIAIATHARHRGSDWVEKIAADALKGSK